MKELKSTLRMPLVMWMLLTFVFSGMLSLIGSSFISGVITFGVIFGIAFLVGSFIRKDRSKKYALERGGEQRLEVNWTYGFKNTTVILDGNEIGSVDSVMELRQGASFQLPNGAILQLKLPPESTLDITWNGKLIPGSFHDPEEDLKRASKAFILGGILNIIAAFSYLSINPGWYTAFLLIFGFTAPIVGVFIRKRSRIALSIGIGYAIIGTLTFLVGIMLSISVGDGFAFFETIMEFADSALFAFGSFTGFEAINKLEEE